MKYTETNKSAILKWREENIDKYREYQRIYAKEHYNKEQQQQKYLKNKEHKKQYYLRKKQLKLDLEEFMSILLD